MADKTITRADLTEAVRPTQRLSRAASAVLVEQVLGAIDDALASGESVKLSGFGVFSVRHKNKRVGHNPNTREAVPIEPRQSLTLSASPVLKSCTNGGIPHPRPRRRRKRPLVLAQAAAE